MKKVRCAHCKCLFVPNPRISNQRYCSKKECQRARKNSWQRRKIATDPDYRANQLECQRQWRSRHPGYWRKRRASHPEYVTRNRMLQGFRRAKQGKGVAKMDALKPFPIIKTGTYYLIPDTEMVAKMDAFAQKVRLISVA